MNPYTSINLIKTATCFKVTISCIDLLLTEQKYLFINAHAFQTGFRDRHLSIYSLLFKKMSRKDWFIETILPFQRTNSFKPMCQTKLTIFKAMKLLKLKPLNS